MPVHALTDNTNGDITVAVYKRKTVLTDAQIKALPTTPVELVPAPGAGKTLIFHRAVVLFHFDADVYTNDNANIRLQVTTQNGDYELSTTRFYLSPATAISFMSPLLFPDPRTGLEGYMEDGVNRLDSTVFDNTALSLFINNGGDGNLTGGDASNTMEVTVFYSIVDL